VAEPIFNFFLTISPQPLKSAGFSKASEKLLEHLRNKPSNYAL